MPSLVEGWEKAWQHQTEFVKTSEKTLEIAQKIIDHMKVACKNKDADAILEFSGKLHQLWKIWE